MGDNAFPYRRLTRSIRMEYGPTPTKIVVPDGFIPKTATAFNIVIGSNSAWACLVGTTQGAYIEVDPMSPGWVWGPGHHGVYSTQRPIFMSIASIATGDEPAGTGVAWINWGIGT